MKILKILAPIHLKLSVYVFDVWWFVISWFIICIFSSYCIILMVVIKWFYFRFLTQISQRNMRHGVLWALWHCYVRTISFWCMLWCVKFVCSVGTSYISAWCQPVFVICNPSRITVGLFINAIGFKKNMMMQVTLNTAIMEYDKWGFHFCTDWCISYVVTTKLNHGTHFRF